MLWWWELTCVDRPTMAVIHKRSMWEQCPTQPPALYGETALLPTTTGTLAHTHAAKSASTPSRELLHTGTLHNSPGTDDESMALLVLPGASQLTSRRERRSTEHPGHPLTCEGDVHTSMLQPLMTRGDVQAVVEGLGDYGCFKSKSMVDVGHRCTPTADPLQTACSSSFIHAVASSLSFLPCFSTSPSSHLTHHASFHPRRQQQQRPHVHHAAAVCRPQL